MTQTIASLQNLTPSTAPFALGRRVYHEPSDAIVVLVSFESTYAEVLSPGRYSATVFLSDLYRVQ